ncbi:hypothetical protein GQ55_9G305100 [Panicum hallii var. hallii]|jgi:jasmonate ZIM domain-containing protein|uniref:Protein TIFY n=5 Tax=Panicum hallii TaxID=206008 RepID=A0A2T7C7U8_9POAL|nr:hypothetical protein PAHAL_9G292900 [Panicum hallii]PUZ39402.1 hypothetical protein GQ55_9G305100 [Panicum hallii var. hallii]
MAAAAATTPPGAGTGSGIASTSRRFAAACGALDWYVKAAERARSVRPLPLMPGADVDAYAPDDDEQEQRVAGPAPAPLTIAYGGRVLVLDDVPADKAAKLLRLAATAARGGTVESQRIAADDLPVARKASLQRFMEKRRGRAAARGAPYRRPDGSDACHDDHLKLAL